VWLIDGKVGGRLPVEDRGLQYGDGLFETMAVIDGVVRHQQLHLARLTEGCIRLNLPLAALAPLPEEIARLARRGGRRVLKLMLTRGDGPRGYGPPQQPTPRRMLGLSDWPAWPDSHATRGVAVRLCETRLGSNPRLAGLKHLNRLEQVLARGEWNDARWQEGLMMDAGHRVVCGTMSNVFAVHDHRLLTPRLYHCGVAGVMRSVVRREAAAHGIVTEEVDLDLDTLAAADELFLTNALIGIWPVRRLGEVRLRRGPVTRLLQRALGFAGAPA
jgi:4-amino-4-deoxychorismate lyase